MRLNHHGERHDDLIRQAIQPAVMIARRRYGPFDAALRRHWRHGPHILVGIASADPAVSEQVYATVRRHVARWMKANPSPVIDPIEYARKSQKLADAEAITIDAAATLQPRDTIVATDYPIPDFLDDSGLSSIRDQFMAACMDEIFALLAIKATSEAALFVALAQRFLAIDRLSDNPTLSFWPMSLRGQVETTRRALPAAHAQQRKLAERMFSALTPNDSQSSWETPWVAILNDTATKIDAHVGAQSAEYFQHVEAAIVGRNENSADPLPKGDIRAVAGNRHHFAYRSFVNMIYGLFPVLGLSASARIFVCHLVTVYLEKARPDILARTEAAADDLLFR